MARIETYDKDTNVTLDDFVIGTDVDENNTTKNFNMRRILNLLSEALGQSILIYKYSDSKDANSTNGYINTNVNTLGSVSNVIINKTDINGENIDVLLNIHINCADHNNCLITFMIYCNF